MGCPVYAERGSRAIQNALGLVVHQGPRHIEAARQARQHAKHYNDFRVGGRVLAVCSLNGQIGLLDRVNQNLMPGDNPSNLHVEQEGSKGAHRYGLNYIVAVFVSGPPQPDTQSGILSPTLHPCGRCRDYLAAVPEAGASTLLISAHPEQDVFEAYTLSELQAIHRGDRSTVAYTDPGFQVWREGAAIYEQYMASPDQSKVPLWEVARQAIVGQLAA